MSIIDGQRVNAAVTNAALVSRIDAQTVAGSKTFTDAVIVTDTTESIDQDTGSIVTDGGLGVEKNINAGGNIFSIGTIYGANLAGTNTGNVTLSPIGTTPNANGASLADQALTLQPASPLFGGVVSAVAQSFAGVKTFLTDIVANTLLQLNGSSSGFVKVQSAAATTSYTLTLPPTAGTNNYVLKTDGTGVTDWIAQGAAGANTTLSNLTSPTAINQDLNLTANNVVFGSGFGIDFSATANGTGTTVSELLNDYERGTFTVTLTATTGTITLVTTQDTMAYVKVGDKVTVTGQLVVQSVSTPTGTLTLNNLPFTSSAGTELSTRTSMSVRADALTATATTSIQGFILASSNTASIEKFTAGAASGLAANVQAGSSFMISLTYFTA